MNKKASESNDNITGMQAGICLPEDAFLEVIETKILRLLLLAIHGHFQQLILLTPLPLFSYT